MGHPAPAVAKMPAISVAERAALLRPELPTWPRGFAAGLGELPGAGAAGTKCGAALGRGALSFMEPVKTGAGAWGAGLGAGAGAAFWVRVALPSQFEAWAETWSRRPPMSAPRAGSPGRPEPRGAMSPVSSEARFMSFT